MTSSTDPAASPSQTPKPRLAYAIATVLGTGYLKPAPGTWGSAVGLLLAVVAHPFTWFLLLGKGIEVAIGKTAPLLTGFGGTLLLLVPSIAVWLILALLGVKTSRQVAESAGVKDPQFVVIDETAGQLIALLGAPVSWKSFLAGFILFRAFDIVKPYPVRQLERLPEGFGIVVDDVAAGLYGLAVMQLLVHFGLFGH